MKIELSFVRREKRLHNRVRLVPMEGMRNFPQSHRCSISRMNPTLTAECCQSLVVDPRRRDAISELLLMK
jgi:hypothetical protein